MNTRAYRSGPATLRGGFTLVEMLVGLMLMSVLVASVVAVLRAQGRAYLKGIGRAESTQKARFALSYLERELRMMGAGTMASQPMVVYGDEQTVIFNADLVTTYSDDGVAVYYDPDAPISQTVGPDSAALVLPNGAAYPRVWYGPGRSPGRAETVTYRFEQESADEYVLVRRINNFVPDTLIRGLERPTGGFFAFETVEPGGQRRTLSTPLVHDDPIHGSPGDTARSARTDSLRTIMVAFDVPSVGLEGEVRRMPARLSVDARNLGLPVRGSCGEPPILGTVPVLTTTTTPSVRISWQPAFDENGGEKDVLQYGLYRAQSLSGPWTSIQVIPLAAVTTYEFEDMSVVSDSTYWYALSTTDCTPAESDWATAGPVVVPAAVGGG